MKRLYNNIWLFSIGFLLATTSCDSFMDIKPVGKVIPETYEDFRGVLTSGYKDMPNNRSLTSLRTDEVAIDPNAWSVDAIKDIYLWNDASADPLSYTFSYQAFYKAIFYANHVINEGSGATNTTKEELDQLLGESYLLRAYMYFYLVNSYGRHYTKDLADDTPGVPIVLDVDLEKKHKISTVAQVYKQIINDVDKGLSLLNIDEQVKGLNYRFSKVSAYGFASRVYQFMGNWEKSLEYVNKSLEINSSLIDLNLLSDDDVKPYNYQSVENILALEQTLYSNIVSEVVVSDKLKSAYNSAGDLRLALYVKNNKPALGSSQENKISMRTSELYLNKAEALLRIGKDKDARTVLLTLLEHRLTPSYYVDQENVINAMSNDELLDYVLEERYRELAFQGFRWFDLRRTTQPQIIRVYNGETYTLKQNDPRYTLQFPQEAIDNNPYLK